MKILVPDERSITGGVERVTLSVIREWVEMVERVERVVWVLPEYRIPYFKSLLPASERLVYETFLWPKWHWRGWLNALLRRLVARGGEGRDRLLKRIRDGHVVRKRADSNGDGESDSWSFYEQGKLMRHEIDRDGDGFRDLVMRYEGGELAREEEDRDGDGRPDLLTVYDKGQVSERHQDLDGDGVPDVASYYEDGKLVRRELRSDRAIEEWSQDGSL